MNHRDGQLGIREFDDSPKRKLGNLSLALEGKHVALGLQKGAHDALDMHATCLGILASCNDLDLAVRDGLSRGCRTTNL
jgi:hypothetical protein